MQVAAPDGSNPFPSPEKAPIQDSAGHGPPALGSDITPPVCARKTKLNSPTKRPPYLVHGDPEYNGGRTNIEFVMSLIRNLVYYCDWFNLVTGLIPFCCDWFNSIYNAVLYKYQSKVKD